MRRRSGSRARSTIPGELFDFFEGTDVKGAGPSDGFEHTGDGGSRFVEHQLSLAGADLATGDPGQRSDRRLDRLAAGRAVHPDDLDL